MTYFRSLMFLLAILGVVNNLDAQALTLEQAIRQALDHGPDNAVVAATLTAARAGDARTQAAAGWTATSSLAYSTAKAINDPVSNFKLTTAAAAAASSSAGTRVSSLASAPDDVMPQQATGTLVLATPVTSLTTTGTETFQVNPDGNILAATTVASNLNQTLLAGYFGGATQAAADKSALTYQSAQATALANTSKVILNVKTAFFTLAAAQDRVDVYTQTLGQRQDALKFTQVKAQVGTATAYDIKVAQAAVRSAQLDLIGGQNALVTAQAKLANLLGPTAGPVKALPSDTSVPATSVEDAVNLALKNRSELITTGLSARSSAIDAAVASGAAIPTVVLTGGVSYTMANAMTAVTTTNVSSLVGTVGVKVTPPNLDGGQADAQALQARNQQAIYQTQLDQLRRSIPVDVTDAWNTWVLNGQRFDLAKTQVDNAEVNRQILKNQFDAGSKLFSDWLTAEVAYSTAQLAVVNARLTWLQSAATLQNLMGL